MLRQPIVAALSINCVAVGFVLRLSLSFLLFLFVIAVTLAIVVIVVYAPVSKGMSMYLHVNAVFEPSAVPTSKRN